PPAPYTPAASPPRAASTLPPQALPPLHQRPARRCSRPPAASPLPYPPAPTPPLRVLLRVPPDEPRSLPTRSGTLGSSLENRSALKIQSSPPAPISPGHLSCTSEIPLPARTGLE